MDDQERLASAEALLASERKFRAFTNQSVDGISVADTEGNYTYVNPAFCRMVGYTEAELLTMTVFDVTADSQDKATFAKSKGSGEGQPLLVVLKRKDGTEFLAEVVGNNISYDQEQGVLGVIRDVTQREQLVQETLALERQVLHTQKLKSLGVLAGGIAHDFNNLLTAILGHASLAREELPQGSEAYTCIEAIEEAARRSAQLAHQMLAYSGKGQFVIEPIHAAELVEGVAHLIEVSIPKKIDFVTRFDPDTPTFEGDATQIRQIVMNLITNAAEAIGEDRGVITLSTGAARCSQGDLERLNLKQSTGQSEALTPGLYTYIQVSDTGSGMDEDTVARLFDPFFTTKFTGRGLGMSAVLGILRGHQGALELTTELGQGTTFKVLFPARAALDTPTPTEEVSPDWTGAGTILLVDDERPVRTVATQLLLRLGFQVLVADNGEEGLEKFRTHRGGIACVLLDLTMPHMGGEETFAAIRQLDPTAKIILTSGYSERTATANLAKQGLTGFIAKPYELQSLRQALARVLAPTEAGRA